MTELLYQTDSYLRHFNARITEVDKENRSIQLERTIFYPGGGGQPYDVGIIASENIELPVIKVKKQNNTVFHFIGGSDPLPDNGSVISGKIDWDRRYKLMRTHTAMHVLCGVIFRDYGASVTGGEMDLLKGRMDFEFETLKGDLVQVIEESVNKEIIQNHDVKIDILPRQEAFKIPDLIRTKINLLPTGIEFVRIVEIVDLDLQADGGTHVNSTSEVGKLRIVDYKSKGAINKRIYIEIEEN